jgi:hydroxylamine reductase (hybrid-cluster protein)
MVDLKDLLEQTAGTGINVYTHGEVRATTTPHPIRVQAAPSRR